MLKTALHATGHGYETGSQGRCTAFDGFTIVANPLGGFSATDRERRSFSGSSGPGVTYGSHAVYLMTREERGERGYYIGMHNGSGRTVWALPACYYYDAETIAALAAMPERALYSVLWGIVEALDNTRRAAMADTASEWRKATVDKRVKVSRQPSKGKAYVWIEPAREPGESDEAFSIRCMFARPSNVRSR